MEKKCKKCGGTKPLGLMKKHPKNEPTMCLACDAEAHRNRKLLNKQKTFEEQKKERFTTSKQLYVPEKGYYRNDGNAHIKSRGFAC